MKPTCLIPTDRHLLDLAGVDGLQVMKQLIGQHIDRLAPFQSLETTVGAQPCSVLRLCENNFRVAWQNEGFSPQQVIQSASTHQQVWVKQLNWLGTIMLHDVGWKWLLEMAVPKPPHRLYHLPMHCAVPARIDRISVLIWRHQLQGQPIFELHTATANLSALHTKLLANNPVS